ncbi:MAG: hypothetical protein QG557_131, partial [Pseudomonadota bacterium]|nr:hypothetical protein [Pseudomonadota bacterium]
ESEPEVLRESEPEVLRESEPEVLRESEPEDLNKYQAESSDVPHGCFDYLWAIIVYIYQYFIQMFEMMSAYISNGNDSAFQKK